MKKLAGVTGGIAIAAVAAACSSTPATKSGTETISGTESGQPAATMLNSNSNAQPVFPVFTYTGPVNTSAKNSSFPATGTTPRRQPTPSLPRSAT